MVSRLVAKVLSPFAERYLEGVDADHLNVSVFSGDIELRDVAIRREALAGLGAPVRLARGQVGRLTVRVPWSKLRSAPVEVTLEDLHVTVQTQPPGELGAEAAAALRERQSKGDSPRSAARWVCEHTAADAVLERTRGRLDALAATLATREAARQEHLAQEKEGSGGSGAASGAFVETVVNNIRVVVRNVHLRLEHSPQEGGGAPFAAGLAVGCIEVATTLADFRTREFVSAADVVHKVLSVKGLGVYVDAPCEALSAAGGAAARVPFAVWQKQMRDGVAAEHQWLLQPVEVGAELAMLSRAAKASPAEARPELAASASMPGLGLAVDRQQFLALAALAAFNEQHRQGERHAFSRALSPALAAAPGSERRRALWRFAGRRVIRSLRESGMSTSGSWRLLGPAAEGGGDALRRRMEAVVSEYVELRRHHLGAKEPWMPQDEEECAPPAVRGRRGGWVKRMLAWYERSLAWGDLERAATAVHRQLSRGRRLWEEKQQQSAARAKKQSWLGWAMGRSVKEAEPEEEEMDIDRAVQEEFGEAFGEGISAERAPKGFSYVQQTLRLAVGRVEVALRSAADAGLALMRVTELEVQRSHKEVGSAVSISVGEWAVTDDSGKGRGRSCIIEPSPGRAQGEPLLRAAVEQRPLAELARLRRPAQVGGAELPSGARVRIVSSDGLRTVVRAAEGGEEGAVDTAAVEAIQAADIRIKSAAAGVDVWFCPEWLSAVVRFLRVPAQYDVSSVDAAARKAAARINARVAGNLWRALARKPAVELDVRWGAPRLLVPADAAAQGPTTLLELCLGEFAVASRGVRARDDLPTQEPSCGAEEGDGEGWDDYYDSWAVEVRGVCAKVGTLSGTELSDQRELLSDMRADLLVSQCVADFGVLAQKRLAGSLESVHLHVGPARAARLAEVLAAVTAFTTNPGGVQGGAARGGGAGEALLMQPPRVCTPSELAVELPSAAAALDELTLRGTTITRAAGSAAAAGLRAGMVVSAVGGEEVAEEQELRERLRALGGGPAGLRAADCPWAEGGADWLQCRVWYDAPGRELRAERPGAPAVRLKVGPRTMAATTPAGELVARLPRPDLGPLSFIELRLRPDPGADQGACGRLLGAVWDEALSARRWAQKVAAPEGAPAEQQKGPGGQQAESSSSEAESEAAAEHPLQVQMMQQLSLGRVDVTLRDESDRPVLSAGLSGLDFSARLRSRDKSVGLRLSSIFVADLLRSGGSDAGAASRLFSVGGGAEDDAEGATALVRMAREGSPLLQPKTLSEGVTFAGTAVRRAPAPKALTDSAALLPGMLVEAVGGEPVGADGAALQRAPVGASVAVHAIGTYALFDAGRVVLDIHRPTLPAILGCAAETSRRKREADAALKGKGDEVYYETARPQTWAEVSPAPGAEVGDQGPAAAGAAAVSANLALRRFALYLRAEGAPGGKPRTLFEAESGECAAGVTLSSELTEAKLEFGAFELRCLPAWGSRAARWQMGSAEGLAFRGNRITAAGTDAAELQSALGAGVALFVTAVGDDPVAPDADLGELLRGRRDVPLALAWQRTVVSLSQEHPLSVRVAMPKRNVQGPHQATFVTVEMTGKSRVFFMQRAIAQLRRYFDKGYFTSELPADVAAGAGAAFSDRLSAAQQIAYESARRQAASPATVCLRVQLCAPTVEVPVDALWEPWRAQSAASIALGSLSLGSELVHAQGDRPWTDRLRISYEDLSVKLRTPGQEWTMIDRWSLRTTIDRELPSGEDARVGGTRVEASFGGDGGYLRAVVSKAQADLLRRIQQRNMADAWQDERLAVGGAGPDAQGRSSPAPPASQPAPASPAPEAGGGAAAAAERQAPQAVQLAMPRLELALADADLFVDLKGLLVEHARDERGAQETTVSFGSASVRDERAEQLFPELLSVHAAPAPGSAHARVLRRTVDPAGAERVELTLPGVTATLVPAIVGKLRRYQAADEEAVREAQETKAALDRLLAAASGDVVVRDGAVEPAGAWLLHATPLSETEPGQQVLFAPAGDSASEGGRWGTVLGRTDGGASVDFGAGAEEVGTERWGGGARRLALTADAALSPASRVIVARTGRTVLDCGGHNLVLTGDCRCTQLPASCTLDKVHCCFVVAPEGELVLSNGVVSSVRPLADYVMPGGGKVSLDPSAAHECATAERAKAANPALQRWAWAARAARRFRTAGTRGTDGSRVEPLAQRELSVSTGCAILRLPADCSDRRARCLVLILRGEFEERPAGPEERRGSGRVADLAVVPVTVRSALTLSPATAVQKLSRAEALLGPAALEVAVTTRAAGGGPEKRAELTAEGLRSRIAYSDIRALVMLSRALGRGREGLPEGSVDLSGLHAHAPSIGLFAADPEGGPPGGAEGKAPQGGRLSVAVRVQPYDTVIVDDSAGSATPVLRFTTAPAPHPPPPRQQQQQDEGEEGQGAAGQGAAGQAEPEADQREEAERPVIAFRREGPCSEAALASTVSCDYFNPHTENWEPVMEPFASVMRWEQGDPARRAQDRTLSVAAWESVPGPDGDPGKAQFVVSNEVVQRLLLLRSSWTEGLFGEAAPQNELSMSPMSIAPSGASFDQGPPPFVLDNQSGYTLHFSGRFDRPTVTGGELRPVSGHDSVLVVKSKSVAFGLAKGHGLAPVINLDLGERGQLPVHLTPQAGGQVIHLPPEVVGTQGDPREMHVRVARIGTQTVATLSSEYVVRNYTATPLEVKVQMRGEHPAVLPLGPARGSAEEYVPGEVGIPIWALVDRRDWIAVRPCPSSTAGVFAWSATAMQKYGDLGGLPIFPDAACGEGGRLQCAPPRDPSSRRSSAVAAAAESVAARRSSVASRRSSTADSCAPPGSLNFYYSRRTLRHGKLGQHWCNVVAISAPLLLENLLPFPLQAQLFRDTDEVPSVEVTVAPGESHEVLTVSTETDVYAVFSLDCPEGGPQRLGPSQRVRIHEGMSTANFEVPGVTLPDDSGFSEEPRGLHLVLLSVGQDTTRARREVSLYAPYWVMNLSSHAGLLLREGDQLISGALPRSCEDGAPLPLLFSPGAPDEELQFECKLRVAVARDGEGGSGPAGPESAESGWSAHFECAALGAPAALTCPAREGSGKARTWLGVSVEMGPGVYMRTKIIKITRRWALRNNSGTGLRIRRREEGAAAELELPDGAELSALPPAPSDEEGGGLLGFSTNNAAEEPEGLAVQLAPPSAGDCEWSRPLIITEGGTHHVALAPAEGAPRQVLECRVVQRGAVTFVIFEAASVAPVSVANLTFLPLRIDDGTSLAPFAVAPVYPAERSEGAHLVRLLLDGEMDWREIPARVTADPVEGVMGGRAVAHVALGHDSPLVVVEEAVMHAARCSAVVASNTDSDESPRPAAAVPARLAVELALSVEVSFMKTDPGNFASRWEIANLTCSGVDMEARFGVDGGNDITLGVRAIQFDDQTRDPLFPVVLSFGALSTDSTRTKEVVAGAKLKHGASQLRGSAVQLFAHDFRRRQGGLTSVRYFELLLQPVNLAITDTFAVDELGDYLRAFLGAAYVSTAVPDLAEVVLRQPQYDAAYFQRASRRVHASELIFHPIKAIVSWRSEGCSHRRSNPLHAMLSTASMAIQQIDRAPVALNLLSFAPASATEGDLRAAIVNHYKWQVLAEGYKVLGSIDILGNPVGLVGNVGDGLDDLWYEPVEGLSRGPGDFFCGVGKGVKSAGAHAVGGVAGVFKSVARAAGGGLAQMSMDDDYVRSRRTSHRRRVATLGGGLAESGRAIGSGFVDAVSGVVMQPVQGARQEGAVGALKGVGKGIVGVPVKILTGMVDGIGKTAEGLQAAVLEEDMRRRLRAARVTENGELRRWDPLRGAAAALLPPGQQLVFVARGRVRLGGRAPAGAVKAAEEEGAEGPQKCTAVLSSVALAAADEACGSVLWSVDLVAVTVFAPAADGVRVAAAARDGRPASEAVLLLDEADRAVMQSRIARGGLLPAAVARTRAVVISVTQRQSAAEGGWLSSWLEQDDWQLPERPPNGGEWLGDWHAGEWRDCHAAADSDSQSEGSDSEPPSPTQCARRERVWVREYAAASDAAAPLAAGETVFVRPEGGGEERAAAVAKAPAAGADGAGEAGTVELRAASGEVLRCPAAALRRRLKLERHREFQTEEQARVTRTVEAFENQRSYGFGYTSVLLPGERPEWSDRFGQHRRDRHAFALEEGWRWLGDWQVDHTNADAEGWQYAVSFAGPYSAQDRWTSSVRRRRWTRVKVKE